METLQDFVSARLADLSTFGRLNLRARQVVRTVSSAAASVRTETPVRMRPGVERC